MPFPILFFKWIVLLAAVVLLIILVSGLAFMLVVGIYYQCHKSSMEKKLKRAEADISSMWFQAFSQTSTAG